MGFPQAPELAVGLTASLPASWEQVLPDPAPKQPQCSRGLLLPFRTVQHFSLHKLLQLQLPCTPGRRLVAGTVGPAELHLTCQSSFSVSLFWGPECCQIVSNGSAAQDPPGCTPFPNGALQPYKAKPCHKTCAESKISVPTRHRGMSAWV